MVDFQSRDTSRGVDEDDGEADETDRSDGPNGEGDASDAAGSEGGDESDATGESDAETAGGGGPEAEEERGPETATAEGARAESSTGEASEGRPGADPLEGPASEAESSDDGDHAGHHHADVEQLGVAVVTVSSTRTSEEDPSGDAIAELLARDGHDVVTRDLVADDLDGVQRSVLALTDRDDVDVVITTGGTGVTPDDVTIEAVRPLFDKTLPGFGELFRVLSYEEVGTRALGSRATAGVSEGVPVFCLPGSEDAVRLGTEELILEEAGHLVGLARGE